MCFQGKPPGLIIHHYSQQSLYLQIGYQLWLENFKNILWLSRDCGGQTPLVTEIPNDLTSFGKLYHPYSIQSLNS